jgi:hypothetical protein
MISKIYELIFSDFTRYTDEGSKCTGEVCEKMEWVGLSVPRDLGMAELPCAACGKAATGMIYFPAHYTSEQGEQIAHILRTTTDTIKQKPYSFGFCQICKDQHGRDLEKLSD